MDLTSPRVLLNGFLENVWATSMPEASEVMLAAHEETAEVGPITLSAATCQTEQIEFVFLRCLVGALNSILVALLIKAVKAKLFGCEPGRLRSDCSWRCTYVNGCGANRKKFALLFRWLLLFICGFFFFFLAFLLEFKLQLFWNRAALKIYTFIFAALLLPNFKLKTKPGSTFQASHHMLLPVCSSLHPHPSDYCCPSPWRAAVRTWVMSPSESGPSRFYPGPPIALPAGSPCHAPSPQLQWRIHVATEA